MIPRVQRQLNWNYRQCGSGGQICHSFIYKTNKCYLLNSRVLDGSCNLLHLLSVEFSEMNTGCFCDLLRNIKKWSSN